MKQINWGFIGCGEVTEKKSGPAFNSIEGSQVVAVMSRSEQKARSYAERHHIRKWYKDAQSLIDDPDVNAIYIATPPSSHATFAIMAMRAGKPVYVEKPLAASYEDCIRINRISEQTGVPCFVAYYSRQATLAIAARYCRWWLFLRSCSSSARPLATYLWRYHSRSWLLCQPCQSV